MLAVSAVEEAGEADCGGTETEAVGVDSDEAAEDLEEGRLSVVEAEEGSVAVVVAVVVVVVVVGSGAETEAAAEVKVEAEEEEEDDEEEG